MLLVAYTRAVKNSLDHIIKRLEYWRIVGEILSCEHSDAREPPAKFDDVINSGSVRLLQPLLHNPFDELLFGSSERHVQKFVRLELPVVDVYRDDTKVAPIRSSLVGELTGHIPQALIDDDNRLRSSQRKRCRDL